MSLLSHDRYQYDSLILSKQAWAYPRQHLQRLLWCVVSVRLNLPEVEERKLCPLRYYENCVPTTLTVLILHNVESVCSFCSNPVCVYIYIYIYIYRSFATTTVSQLKICDFFSGETFSMSATTTQLLSSGEFCKLRYDTMPVKSASANVSFYINDSKMPNFRVVTLLSQMSDIYIYIYIYIWICWCK